MRELYKKLLSLNLALLMVVMLMGVGIVPAQAASGTIILDAGDGKTITGDQRCTLQVDDLDHVTLPDGQGFTCVVKRYDWGTGTYVDRNLFFAGWADPNWNFHLPGSVLSLSDGDRLTAIWSYYSINYIGNGGVDSNGKTSVQQLRVYFDPYDHYSEGWSLFSREGYVFTGWNTEPDGSGTWYRAMEYSDWIIDETELNLYAQWMPSQGDYVRYYVTDQNVSYRYEFYGSYPFTITIPTLPDKADPYYSSCGLLFCGFSLDYSATPREYENVRYYQSYKPGTKLTLTEDIGCLCPVYAKDGTINERLGWITWSEIIYDANGGVAEKGYNLENNYVSPGTLKVYTDAGPFTREGYVFSGWNTEPDGSGDSPEESTYFPNSCGRLYAQWTLDSNRDSTIQFSPVTEQEGMHLWAALYDTDGRMLAITTAIISNGYPQASFKEKEIKEAKEARLFQLDQSFCPLTEVQIKPLRSEGGGGSGGGGGDSDESIIAKGDCGAQGNNVTWTLDRSGLLTISGFGDMADYPEVLFTMPWIDYQDRIKEVVIKNGVTSVGEEAFLACSSLTNVAIPASVTSIGDGAFARCSDLAEVSIPSGVSRIGGGTFYYCSSLDEITIPSGVTLIGDQAFCGCTGLTTLNIPDKVTTIGYEAFSGCTGLTKLTIPKSVTSIDEYAFSGCSNLSHVIFSPGATVIGPFMFSYCDLTSLTIPSSLTQIMEGAFFDCGVSDVYYYGTEQQWNNINLGDWNYGLMNASIHYISSGSGGGDGSTLASPQNLRWETSAQTVTEPFTTFDGNVINRTYNISTGWLSWDASPDKAEEYILEIFNEAGESIDYSAWNENAANTHFYSDNFLLEPRESGKYRFCVQAVDSSGVLADSNVVYSDYWTYTKPSASLSAPTGLYMDGTTLRWTADTRASGYYLDWSYSETETGNRKGGGCTWSVSDSRPYDTSILNMFRKGDGYYHVHVRSLSNDITTICPSDWSDYLTLHIVNGVVV